MNRRTLIFGGLKLAAVASIAPELFLTGCNQSQKDRVSAYVKVIGQYGAQLAVQLGQGSLATQIASYTTTVLNIVAAWQVGTTTQDQVIQAINTLLGLLYQIPQTAPYAALAQLIVTAAEAIITLIVPAMPAGAVQARSTRKGWHPSQAEVDAAPKSAKEFEKRYKALAASNPQTASLAK